MNGEKGQRVSRRYWTFGRLKIDSDVKIMCVTDGKEFASINDAAKHYNVFRENIRKVLHGKYKHTGGRLFKYVSDDREAG